MQVNPRLQRFPVLGSLVRRSIAHHVSHLVQMATVKDKPTSVTRAMTQTIARLRDGIQANGLSLTGFSGVLAPQMWT